MRNLLNLGGSKIGPAAIVTQEYGDEVLCAEWNPQLALVGDRPIGRTDRHTDIAGDRLTLDVDDFLRKMYTHQGR